MRVKETEIPPTSSTDSSLSSSPFSSSLLHRQSTPSSSSPMTTSSSSSTPVVSGGRKRMSTSSLPYLFTVAVVLLCCAPVQSRWCTRLFTYTTIKPYVVQSTCTQSYQEECGFWTYAMCTRYEEVPCMEERNKTLTVYKIKESCCPGFRLNPLNNLTCERIHVKTTKGDYKILDVQNGSDLEEKVTPTQYPNLKSSPLPVEPVTDPALLRTPAIADTERVAGSSDGESESTRAKGYVVVPDSGTVTQHKETETKPIKKSSRKSLVEEGHDGRVEFYHSESDSKLFGLTKGAYAGIVCSAVFLLCVVVLVSIRLYKRQRNNQVKREKKHQVELEAKQSMMSKSEVQGIA